MKNRLMPMACLLAAATAAAQQNDSYLGPGVLSRGAGDIGTRSGKQVDLRFYAGVSEIYDNELQPVSVDSKGNLVVVHDLYGVEGNIGAYGIHNFKTSELGLDYKGVFRHYNTNSYFDGSDHSLTLGYTVRKSRRVVFDLRQVAGTYAQGIWGVYGATPLTSSDIVNQPTALLFDNRAYFLQSTMDVSYLASARTIYTAGGDGFLVRRQSSALAGVNGYNLRGSIDHRVSRNTSIGVNYEHTHFDYPKFFGEADLNQAQGFFATQLGRRWTFSAAGGVYLAEVQGLQQVSVDPAVQALLGVSVTVQAFYRKVIYPSVDVRLTRQFKNSSLSLNYNRTVLPGNGIYLTSRAENGQGIYSYSGIQKWNFSIGGGYNSLGSVGQGLPPYQQYNGFAGITYGITRSFHIVTRYDARHQEILPELTSGYRRTGYRATLGLMFSPGDVPLSLW